MLWHLQGESTYFVSNKYLVGIPKIYWFGEEGGCNIMILEILGKNLEELFNHDFKRQFSLMTILLLID